MTPRSRSQEFPSQRGGMDWWSCRSRSPLLDPSRMSKNHGGESRDRASSSKITMEERERKNLLAQGGRRPIYSVRANITVGEKFFLSLSSIVIFEELARSLDSPP